MGDALTRVGEIRIGWGNLNLEGGYFKMDEAYGKVGGGEFIVGDAKSTM